MRIPTWIGVLFVLGAFFIGCAQVPSSAPTQLSANLPAASASVPTATPTAQPSRAPSPQPTVATPTSVPTVVSTDAAQLAATSVTTATNLTVPAAMDDINDTAHLDGNVAPLPTDTPPSAPTAQPPELSEPVRIQIPAINLDYKPLSVGLDKKRVPVVPKHDIGWYNLSAMPGQGDNIVFWGHVLRFKSTPKIAAPFARVKELQPGAEIIVTTANGTTFRYHVTRAVQVTPDQVEYIMPTRQEHITLVSCIGDNVVVAGSVSKKYRLVTIAEPVQ